MEVLALLWPASRKKEKKKPTTLTIKKNSFTLFNIQLILILFGKVKLWFMFTCEVSLISPGNNEINQLGKY